MAKDDFTEDIRLDTASHRRGCAALSGAEVVLDRARRTYEDLAIELEVSARRAREAGLDTGGIDGAICVVRELARDLTIRRAALLEFHRDFRGLDASLTPTRPPSNPAFAAYLSSANFAERKTK